jgi:hypothetical protein
MHERSAPSLLLWIVVLGLSGFIASFLGPIELNPDANQGPLVGILITSPGGALLGLLLGAALRWSPIPGRFQWNVLWGCTAALGFATLYFCLPEPAVRGDVIEARVRACRPAAEGIEAAIADWDKRIAGVTWAPPRAGWQDEAHQMPQHDAGVILDMQISRRNALLEQRKPWNKGRLSAAGWLQVDETKSYFARNADGICANYRVGETAQYFPQGTGSKEWPPNDLPNFLGLQVLEPVPVQYASLFAH